MSTQLYRKIGIAFESSRNIKAASIERRVHNDSGANITVFKPVCNAGWDTTENCMKIRMPNDVVDVIIGIIVDSIDDGQIKVIKYVSNGLVTGIDTSAWALNDILYVKLDGSFTNNPALDPANTIPQQIGLVMRSDAVEGEIYITNTNYGIASSLLQRGIIYPENYGAVGEIGRAHV